MPRSLPRELFLAFLEEEGLRAEAEAVAVNCVIAIQLVEFMKQQKLTKTQLAKHMGTRRSALERLLNPDKASASISRSSLQRSHSAFSLDVAAGYGISHFPLCH